MARVDVPGRAHRGQALSALPLPRLRGLGRELDTTASLLPAVLDGETPVLIRCLLDLTAVYQGLDGERGVAAVARLLIDPRKVRWRDVQHGDPTRRYVAPCQRDDEARARGRAHSAQVWRERAGLASLPGIGTTEAAELAGVSTSAMHTWLATGRLPCTVHVVGAKTVRRVRPEDVLKMKKADVTGLTRP